MYTQYLWFSISESKFLTIALPGNHLFQLTPVHLEPLLVLEGLLGGGGLIGFSYTYIVGLYMVRGRVLPVVANFLG